MSHRRGSRASRRARAELRSIERRSPGRSYWPASPTTAGVLFVHSAADCRHPEPGDYIEIALSPVARRILAERLSRAETTGSTHPFGVWR